MFEDFTLKIKNITKDKVGKEEVKTLRKSIFEVAEAVEKFALNFSKKIQGILKQSTSENRNPSNCETFLLLCYWKLFLNNRLVTLY